MFNNKNFANEFFTVFKQSSQQYWVYHWIWTSQRNSVFRYPSKTRPQHHLYDICLPGKDIHKSFSILNGTLSPRKYWKYILLNLIRTVNYRCYQICSSFSLLQSALGDLLKKTSSEWLPSRNNKLPRQWCVGTKPKQARCSCSYGSLEGSYYFVTLFRSSKQPNF